MRLLLPLRAKWRGSALVRLSRFAHSYELDGAVALYHSLRMRPVYLKRNEYENLQAWLAGSFCVSLEDAPVGIRPCVEELIKNRILTHSDGEDGRVLEFVRSRMPSPSINVCYFILSEQCNLACKYCFLGNNDVQKRARFSSASMTKETAEKALQFFARQIKLSNAVDDFNHPIIIFYGGEPLLNFEVLDYVAERINEMRTSDPIFKNAELSVVTNGTLLDVGKVKRLQQLNVGIGISIDGFTETSNAMRVDVSNKPAYPRILSALELCRDLGVDVSLSVTLSEETVKHKDEVLNLIKRFKIKSLGFNILMSSEAFPLPSDYSERAARFIIDEFISLRDRGVYEDRMMRKLKAFTKAQVYYSDCAATSGGQIVIAPNGRVGICHGCLHDKKYFVTDVDDSSFCASKHPTYLEWASLSPVNKEECLDCPALGICGGGCPINAMNAKSENTIHSMDERFCVHSKLTLEFFIRDLYRIMIQKRTQDS